MGLIPIETRAQESSKKSILSGRFAFHFAKANSLLTNGIIKRKKVQHYWIETKFLEVYHFDRKISMQTEAYSIYFFAEISEILTYGKAPLVTCMGDWEIGAVSVRLIDNPGELVDDMPYHGTTLY